MDTRMEDTKNTELKLRISSKEKEHIRQKAIKCGLTMSKYIRRAALGWDAPDPEETEGLGDK